MNRYALIIAVFAVVAASAYAAAPLSTNSSPQSEPMAGWDDVAQAFRAILVGSDGSVTTTSNVGGSAVSSSNPVPAYDARGRVSSPTRFAGTIATNTVKLLSQMASFTPPCVIRLQFMGVVYEDIATTTAATVAAGYRYAAYDTVWINPASTSFDLGYLASSTAAAAYAGHVFPLVP